MQYEWMHAPITLDGKGHDPAGKVRLGLGDTVRGEALFSTCQRYRPALRRWQGSSFPEHFALFIGMNPSTADAGVDDPTVRREWDFALREGYSGMAKVNVGDYRATHPRMLGDTGVQPVSPDNQAIILSLAGTAGIVIVCHGRLPKPLRPQGIALIASLRQLGRPLWCFGINGDGSPKHPLYLPKNTPLVHF